MESRDMLGGGTLKAASRAAACAAGVVDVG